MENVQELIDRARRFASLARTATPGPWEWCRGFGAPVLLGDHKTRWVLKEELRYNDPASPIGRGAPSNEDKSLIAAAPDMAELLGQIAEQLAKHRRVLTIIAKDIDGWEDVDLHLRAFEIAVRRDPSYEDGSRDPEPDDYAQALLEAVLGC